MGSTLVFPHRSASHVPRRRAQRSPARRPARGRRQAGISLPDWAWGAVLGGLFVIALGGFFLGRTVMSGGGGSTCDKALPPLGSSEISEQAFQEEDAALGRILDMLTRGDVQSAESAFFGPVHNFTHNIDPRVREQNEELAKQLCKAVIQLEDSLAFDRGAVKIGLDMQAVRNLLRDSAQALGYSRPH